MGCLRRYLGWGQLKGRQKQFVELLEVVEGQQLGPNGVGLEQRLVDQHVVAEKSNEELRQQCQRRGLFLLDLIHSVERQGCHVQRLVSWRMERP